MQTQLGKQGVSCVMVYTSAEALFPSLFSHMITQCCRFWATDITYVNAVHQEHRLTGAAGFNSWPLGCGGHFLLDQRWERACGSLKERS